MLIKKLYIMKGAGTAKSVLKINLLENGYSEIDLQTHFAYGDYYTFLLKSGSFIHVETMRSKGLKRKLQPFSLDGLCAGIAKDGKIIMWCADTPSVPYCLIELAQKYTTVKVQNLLDDGNRNSNSVKRENPQEVNASNFDENAKKGSLYQETETNQADENIKVSANVETADDSQKIATASFVAVETNTTEKVVEPEVKDITDDFNILSVETESFTQNDSDKNSVEEDYTTSMAREIESKYASYPHNHTLENLFPDSKWILEQDNELSLGLLYNSEKITHICYAKRGEKDKSFDHNASYYDGWWINFVEL